MKTLSMYPHKTDDKATIYLIFRKHAKHTIILLRNDCIYGIFLHVSAIKYTIKWHKAVQCASTCNLWFPIRREVATCVPLVFWKSWTGRFICKKSLNKCKMSLWLFTDKIWLKYYVLVNDAEMVHCRLYKKWFTNFGEMRSVWISLWLEIRQWPSLFFNMLFLSQKPSNANNSDRK